MRALLGILVVLALVTTGCGEGSDRPAPRSGGSADASAGESTSAGGHADGAPGGIIEAEVRYSGPRVVETIKVNKDVQQCGEEKEIEKVAVGPDHGLRDAVVSVADRDGAPTPKARTLVLDQKGCEFSPHVLVMTPGEVDIVNPDGILHNIHTFSTANPTINKAQPKFKKVMTVEFEEPEIIRVQCDVHSWMHGWIAVMPSPYFGITDDKGVVRIENVPAGKQRIEVWHPVLGKHTKEVQVTAGQTTRVTFELTERSATAPRG